MTIVSLSVRYKSATVEEFIEKHAADVSGHGIFVKTDREFALGTLLQLDVRIADKQTLIAGVGRVVWRRAASAGTEKPVGVGVQFLRIDKSSRAMIDRLLAAKPDAGKRYQAEAEMAGPPPEAPSSLPELPTNPRPAGATSPTGVRPRPGWHKTTLVGVGHAAVSPLATPAPPPAAPSLPPPVPPPRRPTGHHSVIPAPPATLPSKALVDSFHEKEDLTLIGDLPEMPEERKTTLVGVGGAPILAPRLPPPVAPPRLGGLLRKPAPVATPAPALVAPVATESAPLVNESDIEVASLLPHGVDDDEPEEETRMQSVDDLLGPAISIPSAVATAPMLPLDPSPMIPIETILPAPVETSPMFPVDSEPPPRVEPAPPPAPRVPLPLVLPPRELFVPPLPTSATQASLAQTGPQAGVLTRTGSASGRDKAIAAVGAGLFVCALVAFVAAHPWASSDAVDPSAPKATATASAAPHSATEWTATRRTATAATAAAPSEVTAPNGGGIAAQAPTAPPPPAPPQQPAQAPAVQTPMAQVPAPQPPAPQAAQPPPVAATPPAATPPPAAPPAAAPPPAPANPPPRPRATSTPAPAPSPPPVTPPSPPAPVATAAPPRAAAPKPAPTQAHPPKSSVDDGF